MAKKLPVTEGVNCDSHVAVFETPAEGEGF
jgi:hypothetical protein